ncbi:hypothetical protein NC652_015064 [Populus alba x Populus x berolinensis]|nr:hypothetical protein NC652_015064 [Populus alba x Populus x berolinensis]
MEPENSSVIYLFKGRICVLLPLLFCPPPSKGKKLLVVEGRMPLSVLERALGCRACFMLVKARHWAHVWVDIFSSKV